MSNMPRIEWRPNTNFTNVSDIYIQHKRVGWLQPRPAYCDRGHWQVNVELPDIDNADGFPRYYMSRTVAVSETEAFLRWRLWREQS